MSNHILLRLFKPYRHLLLSAIVLQIIAALFSLVPWGALVMLSYYWRNNMADQASTTFIILLVVGIVCWLIGQMLAFHITHLLDAKFTLDLRTRLTQHLQKLPIHWLLQQGADGIAKSMNHDVKALHQLIAHTPMDITKLIITPIIIVAILASFNSWLLLLMIIPLASACIGYQRLTSPHYYADEVSQRNQSLEKLLQDYAEFANNLPLAKEYPNAGIHAVTQDAAHHFQHAFGLWVQRVGKLSALIQITLGTPFLWLWCLLAVALLTQFNLPVFEVVLFLLFSRALASPIQAMGHGTDFIRQGIQSAQRLDNIFSIPPLAEGSLMETPKDHTIVLSNLSFQYNDTLILNRINCTIPHHTTVAIVGHSGMGKSTLLHLLARFMEPSEGAITIGGQHIQDFTTATLYQLCSVLLQNPAHLQIAIRDNLRLLNPQASDNEITKVIDAVQLSDKIQSLPQGLATILGKETQFSGGELQRLALARAFLAPNTILLLDEPTSALDPITTQAIEPLLFANNRTVIFTTHDLNLASKADQILLLTKDEEVIMGHHDTLLHNHHSYAQLWRAQHD